MRYDQTQVQQYYCNIHNFMTTCLPHKYHPKRGSGFTGALRQTLLKAQKSQDQGEIISDLMAKMNSTSTHDSNRAYHCLQKLSDSQQLQRKAQFNATQLNTHQNNRVSVENQQRLQFHDSVEKLNRVLSVDKVSFRMGNQKKGRKVKKQKTGLFCEVPKNLSKKSTEYSLHSQEQALKKETEQFRELCVREQQRMNKLERQIDNQNKVQLLKRHLYQQNIERLKKIAALQIFPSDGSDEINDSEDQQFCQEYDCLSIESR